MYFVLCAPSIIWRYHIHLHRNRHRLFGCENYIVKITHKYNTYFHSHLLIINFLCCFVVRVIRHFEFINISKSRTLLFRASQIMIWAVSDIAVNGVIVSQRMVFVFHSSTYVPYGTWKEEIPLSDSGAHAAPGGVAYNNRTLDMLR